MPTEDLTKKTVATPEGDNEFAPDQPLKPTVDGLETPAGSAPDPYKEDKHESEEEKPSGIVKFIDEVARGEFM